MKGALAFVVIAGSLIGGCWVALAKSLAATAHQGAKSEVAHLRRNWIERRLHDRRGSPHPSPTKASNVAKATGGNRHDEEGNEA